MIGQPQKATDTEKYAAQKSQPAIHTAKGTDKHDNTNAHQSSTREEAARLYASAKRSVVSAWGWAEGHSADWWLAVAAFLTLMFLGWQAWETRRAVMIGLRPRLVIRRVWLKAGTMIPTLGVPDAHPWTVEFDIGNIGGSAAKVTSSSFALTVFARGLPTRLAHAQQTGFKPFSLQPGEEREMSISVGDDLVNLFRVMGGTVGPYLKYQDTGHVYFWGYAQYRDKLGIARNIAALRHYDSEVGKFKAVDDPEREFAD
jgi:hypothetical protein